MSLAFRSSKANTRAAAANGDRLNSMKPCPFCSLPLSRVIDSSPLALVIRDAFPISTGHTLIIPKRHIGSFFDLAAEERAELLALLDKAGIPPNQ